MCPDWPLQRLWHRRTGRGRIIVHSIMHIYIRWNCCGWCAAQVTSVATAYVTVPMERLILMPFFFFFV